MANRTLRLVVVAVLATLVLAACSGQEPARTQGPGTGAAKADDPRAAASFDRLVALLRADGTVIMPPLGTDNAANELDAKVTVHAAGEVKTVASELISEISAEYAVDAATGTLVDHYDDDVNVLLVSGWNDEAIARDLLALIAAGKRDEVSALLDGSLLHFRIYQTASEITAEEIFVYRPSDLKRALILRVSYVHA
jgi:hypothetical protein